MFNKKKIFDSHARFYEPQHGRWFVPDPAEQFHNPYLAMGNNPVVYTDPDGEFAFLLPFLQAAAIGAGIGAASYTAQVGFSDGGFQQNWDNGSFWKSVGFGAISGAVSYGIGQLNMGELNSTVAHGISQGMISEFSGGDFESGFGAGIFGSFTSATLINGGGSFGASKFGNITLSGLAGGIGSYASGGNFWSGVGVGATVSSLNHLVHKTKKIDPKKQRLKSIILADGKLTREEANLWYRYGRGSSLTVDAAKVDLDFVNPDYFVEGSDRFTYVQTLLESSDGDVYGNLGIRRIIGNRFEIHTDNYGFELKGNDWFRDFATIIGHISAGWGHSFDIKFQGFNTVDFQPSGYNYPRGYKW